MKTSRWITWTIVAGVVLGACAPPVPAASESPVPTCSSQERCRAWILFDAVNLEEAVPTIESMLAEGDQNYVVIRADIVTGEYNLVVPVDVASQSELDSLVAQLTRMVETARPALVLVVQEHHPEQTTRSHSFVTEAERVGFEEEFLKAGRQIPNSPGANPWG